MPEAIDARLVNSRSVIVAGPAQCGKSTFVFSLLSVRHLIFRSPISKIYWICNEIPKFNKRDDCEYIMCIPEAGLNFVLPNSIIVIDDLMEESKNNSHVTNLFTKVSHHISTFIIYISQNYFSQSKDEITRRRNCQYIVLFKNHADVTNPYHWNENVS